MTETLDKFGQPVSREVVVIARALATHSRNGTPYEGPYNIEDWYEYARIVARALREDAER